MKKFELFFAFFQVPLDYLAIVLAGFTAYSLRFTEYMKDIRPVTFNIPWDRFWPAVLIVAAAWIIVFAFSGLYNTYPPRRMARDFWRIIIACSTGFAGITIYVFFTLQKFDSRFLVLAGWIIAGKLTERWTLAAAIAGIIFIVLMAAGVVVQSRQLKGKK